MAEYDGKNQRKWHVNREVSLGDVLSLMAALAVGFSAYTSLTTRVSLLEQAQAAQKEESISTSSRLESNIAEINRKLDRLIERR